MSRENRFVKEAFRHAVCDYASVPTSRCTNCALNTSSSLTCPYLTNCPFDQVSVRQSLPSHLKSKGIVKIHSPQVTHTTTTSRLSCKIDVEQASREVWFEVAREYGDYLCFERSDAFLIALLNWAMREHYDIVCEAPVTAQLLYQIETYLIPSLVRNSTSLYTTQIEATRAETLLPNAGGVGCGISCGVDSLHVVKNYHHHPITTLRLTHLVLNNVGAFHLKEGNTQYQWQCEQAKAFCKEVGLPFIQTNSNLSSAFVQNHLRTHTYSSCFAIYALQKLWQTYFYASSGRDFEAFTLRNNDLYDAAKYELLSLDVFSTRNLKIYSEGGAITRFEKVVELLDYEPATRYLHVCTSDLGPNCGRCDKCLRTLTALDALHALEKFSKVFDIQDYLKRRHKNLKWLYLKQWTDSDRLTVPAYQLLKSELTIFDKWYVRYRTYRKRLSAINWLYRLYHIIFKQ